MDENLENLGSESYQFDMIRPLKELFPNKVHYFPLWILNMFSMYKYRDYLEVGQELLHEKVLVAMDNPLVPHREW